MLTLSMVVFVGACILPGMVATGDAGQSADPRRVDGRPADIWPFVDPPDRTVAVPVVASRVLDPAAGAVRVCVREGAPPKTYEVINRACRSDADACTIHVAVPKNDYATLLEYDVLNPPVATASDAPCTQPRRSPPEPLQ